MSTLTSANAPSAWMLRLTRRSMPSSEVLRSFFHRFLEVVAVDAVLLHRAVLAVFARVASLLALVAGLRRMPVCLFDLQLAVVCAEVGVVFREVRHVFEAADVVLPFPRLALLVIAGLDEGFQPMFFEVGVVFLALVAGIRNDVLAACPVILLELTQEGDERVSIGSLRPDARPEDEFGVAAVLDVVGGLELAVLHGIFFHAHERRGLVGLREAVVASHFVEIRDVILQPHDIAVELFKRSLERRLPLSRTMDEDDALRRDLLAELATKVLEVAQMNRVPAGNVDVEVGGCFFEEGRELG